MKKTKRLAIVIAVLLLIVVAIPSPMHAESLTKLNLSAEAESWYYPVLPGDEEWATLDPWEAYEVCNMPEHLLKVCSTERLAELVLDYPYVLDVWAFDTTNIGLAHLKSVSNIYKEFFSRENALDAMLKKYAENEVDYSIANASEWISTKSQLVASGYSRDIFAQIYIGYNYDKLTPQQIVKLRNTLGEKFEAQCDSGEEFTFFSAAFYNEVSKKTGKVPDAVVPENVVTFLLNNYESVNALDYSFVATGSGSEAVYPVTNQNENVLSYTIGNLTHENYGNKTVVSKRYSTDFQPSVKDRLDDYYNVAHPNLTKLSSSTHKYNCHSYSWVATSYSNIDWVEHPNALYLNNTAYVTYKGNNCAAAQGDKVVFYGSDGSTIVHSVVVTSGGATSSSIITKAKMGVYGVYTGTLASMLGCYPYSASTYRVYDTLY